MANANGSPPKKTCVVCSYQGGFSPPTVGHKEAARIIANKLLELYPGLPITFLFMPTANITSKQSISLANAKKPIETIQGNWNKLNNAKKAEKGPRPTPDTASDYVSQNERLELLNVLCDELNTDFAGKGVTFEASDKEYKLAPTTKSTATIFTLDAMSKMEDTCYKVVAMGEDNGNQLYAWVRLAEYPALVDKILFVSRKYPPDDKKAIAYDATLVTDSTLPFAQVAAGVTDAEGNAITTMRFEPMSPWAITFDGREKKIYPFAEIMATDNSISRALQAIAAKTYLLEAPPAVSSTALRKALREGREAEAETIAGSLLPIIKAKRILTRTRANVLADIAASKLDGGRRRSKKSKKPTKSSKKSHKRRRL